MADITLTVGVDPDIDYSSFESGINSIASKYDSNPLKIKVKFDDSSISKMKSDIQNLSKSLSDSFKALDTKSLSSASASVQDLVSKVDTLTTSVDALSKKMSNLKFGGGNGSSNDPKTSTQKMNAELLETSKMIQKVEAELKKSTAAQNGQASGAYADLENTLASLYNLRDALESNSIKAKDYAESMSALKLSFQEDQEAIRHFSEDTQATTDSMDRAMKTVLSQDSTKYIQSLTKVEDKLKSVQGNMDKWSGLSTGSTQGTYNAYSDIAKSVELLTSDLQSGTLTVDEFNNRLADINAASKNLESSLGSSFQGATDQLNNLVSQAKEIGNLEIEMKGLEIKGGSEQSIDVLKQKIDTLKTSYNQAVSSFKTEYPSFDTSKLDATTQATTENLEKMERKAQEARQQLADKITLQFDTKDFAAQVADVEAKVGQLKTVSQDTQDALNTLRESETNLNEAIKTGSPEDIIEAYNKYNEALKTVNNQVKINADQTGKVSSSQNQYLATMKQTASVEKQYADEVQKVNTALANSAAAKVSSNEVAKEAYSNLEKEKEQLQQLNEAYKNDGDVAKFKTGIQQITQAANESTQSLASCGYNVLSFTDRLSQGISTLSSLVTKQQLVSRTVRTIRDAVTDAMDIESEMAQIQVVTGATGSDLDAFFEESTDMAKELGQSITDVASSIETFSRLGYDLPDASELAKYASILSNVAAVETDDATTGLTAIIKGFNMDVSEAEHVSDVLVDIGQNYAVSAEEIMEAMEKSSAAFAATDTSFEKSVAIIAAGNAAVQDASTVGTALKTVSARVRGATTELDELGEETDGLADGLSKYREEIEQLTGFDIMVNDNTYKDIYDIFDGISQVWDKLSDTAQSRVSEILGGTRQLQVISSIMGNWDDAADAYAEAMNSAGVATEANEVVMDTTAMHVAQFQASFEALSSDMIGTDFMKGVVDAGTALLDVLDQLINTFGTFGTVGMAAFAGLAIKSLAWPKIIGDNSHKSGGEHGQEYAVMVA